MGHVETGCENARAAAQERWAPVVGFEGLYDVSSFGNVRRSHFAPPAKSTTPGRVLKPSDHNGYRRVTLHKNRRPHRLMVHRLMAAAFLEPARPFMHVNHKDGNKHNNMLENLEWATPQANVRHAWETGLCAAKHGEESHLATLTQADVDVIRRARGRGVSLAKLAEVFGVTETAISYAYRGLTFKENAA